MSDAVTNRSSHCAPTRYVSYIRTGTCLTPEELVVIAKQYNESAEKRIPATLIASDKAASGELYAALAERIGGKDVDWFKQPWLRSAPGVSKRLIQSAFRPEMPRAWLANSRAWLSTDDIDRVMRQYEEQYPSFKFLGTFPIDFDTRTLFGRRCIADEMCNLSVKRLNDVEQKTQFGAVLNLDKHNQRGSHWVAVYGTSDASSPNFGVHYFDSVGRKAPAEVARFQARIASQIAALSGKDIADVPITTRVEKRQFKNTECGVFSMYFLVCCMSGKMTVKDIVHAMGSDDLIHRLRFVFFRPPSSS